MKLVSDALRAHLALQRQTMAMCWLCVRSDGSVFAFTNHDRDLAFDLEAAMIARGLTPATGISGTGSQTYLAASGFAASEVATAAVLNVDTGEAMGALSSDVITEDDLRAGLWDDCAITVFQVNWADLSMGALIEISGSVGEVSWSNGAFRAEWRSLLQRYQITIGRLDSPMCNAIFGDARCGVNLGSPGDSPTGYTFAGTLDSVSSSGLVLYDAARMEAGPSGGVAITNITNANPGIVEIADGTAFFNGEAVTLSGIVEPASLNNVTIIRSLQGDVPATFSLGIDTSDTAVYPPFTADSPSQARVTPLGAESGYFDHGKVTITSGPNSGFVREIKAYVPGQIVLQLPFPYSLTGGETYEIVAGCDKAMTTCRDRFNNIVNFRGLPYLPGIDKVIQIGRRQ